MSFGFLSRSQAIAMRNTGIIVPHEVPVEDGLDPKTKKPQIKLINIFDVMKQNVPEHLFKPTKTEIFDNAINPDSNHIRLFLGQYVGREGFPDYVEDMLSDYDDYVNNLSPIVSFPADPADPATLEKEKEEKNEKKN